MNKNSEDQSNAILSDRIIFGLLGIIASACGAIIFFGATSWLTHVQDAVAESRDQQTIFDRRITIVEKDIGAITESQKRAERTLEKLDQTVDEIRDVQRRTAQVIDLLPAGEGRRDSEAKR